MKVIALTHFICRLLYTPSKRLYNLIPRHTPKNIWKTPHIILTKFMKRNCQLMKSNPLIYLRFCSLAQSEHPEKGVRSIIIPKNFFFYRAFC